MLLTAAGLLRNLAHATGAHVPAMQDAGAFEALADVLRRSSDSGVLEQVASALCNATASNLSPIEAAAAAACVAAGAHSELLRHLSTAGSESLGAEAKSALAAATRALCIHAAGKAAVVEAGGLDVLARCLGDSSAEVQKEAAAALMNLACGSDQWSSVVAAHPQALPALARLLRSGEAQVQAAALSAVNNITWNALSSTSALVASGALSGLVQVLVSSNEPVQLVDAAGQLAVLSAQAPEARDAAVAAGAVTALRRLCNSGSAAVRSAAAEALEELDADEGGEEVEPPGKRSRRDR